MKRRSNLFIAKTALLAAAALVLSVLELLLPDIPVPVPGAKPGFSNIAIILSLETSGLASGLSIAVIKAIFALFTRGATAFAMSLFGGVLSTAAMYALIKIKPKGLGYTGIAVTGALLHNTGQLFVSALIAGCAVFAYTPILMIISVIFGTVTGVTSVILLPPVKTAVNKIFSHRQLS